MTIQTFKQVFFRIYDRKIASGEITFSRSGISKNDFTRLCTEDGFIPPKEALMKMCEGMLLSEDERRELLEAAAACGENL